jgi:hypothetical protein
VIKHTPTFGGNDFPIFTSKKCYKIRVVRKQEPNNVLGPMFRPGNIQVI